MGSVGPVSDIKHKRNARFVSFCNNGGIDPFLPFVANKNWGFIFLICEKHMYYCLLNVVYQQQLVQKTESGFYVRLGSHIASVGNMSNVSVFQELQDAC